MTRAQLELLFKCVFPAGDSRVFVDHIFRIFDDDKNGTIEFKEFILALAVTQLQSERDKLSWAFRLYDIDGGGTINVTEMQQIIETLDQIEGRAVNAIDTTGKNILINELLDLDGKICREIRDCLIKMYFLSFVKTRQISCRRLTLVQQKFLDHWMLIKMVRLPWMSLLMDT